MIFLSFALFQSRTFWRFYKIQANPKKSLRQIIFSREMLRGSVTLNIIIEHSPILQSLGENHTSKQIYDKRCLA